LSIVCRHLKHTKHAHVTKPSAFRRRTGLRESIHSPEFVLRDPPEAAQKRATHWQPQRYGESDQAQYVRVELQKEVSADEEAAEAPDGERIHLSEVPEAGKGVQDEVGPLDGKYGKAAEHLQVGYQDLEVLWHALLSPPRACPFGYDKKNQV
jgi:hypothetical protein